METLWKPLEELNAYGGARECIERGRMPVQISGCIDGQKSHLIRIGRASCRERV